MNLSLAAIGFSLLAPPFLIVMSKICMSKINSRSYYALLLLGLFFIVASVKSYIPFPKPTYKTKSNVEVIFESMPNEISNTSKFYLLKVEDSYGNIVIPASSFTNGNAYIKGGAVAKNGHGIWSDLPRMGDKLKCYWRGEIDLPREVNLYIRTTDAHPGSTLKTTVTINGHQHQQVVAITGGATESTFLIPLIHKPAFTKHENLLLTLLLVVPLFSILTLIVREQPPNNNKNIKVSPMPALESCAFTMLGFLFWSAMGVAITLLLGCSINRLLLPISYVVTLGTTHIFAKRFDLPFIKGIIWATILTVFAVGLSTIQWDDFWDSNVYHYPILEFLKAGWNPVFEAQPSDQLLGEFGRLLPLTNHINVVPKAHTYIASVIGVYIDHVESGNFSNLLLIVIAAISVYSALTALLPDNSIINKILALAVALNPVAIAQWQCGYVDGRVASLMAISIFTTFAYVNTNEKKMLWYSLPAQTLLVCMKLSALIYLGVWWVGLLAYATLAQRKCLPALAKHLVLLGIVTVVMGWHPYMTNVARHKSPFYPVLTPRSGHNRYMKSTTYSGPIAFKSLPRVKSFVASHIVAAPASSEVFESKSIVNYGPINAVTYIGMYGPLHSKIVLPSALLLLLIALLRVNDKRVILALAILLSIFIGPTPWYSRYVPQVYIFTVFMLILSSPRNTGKKQVQPLLSPKLALLLSTTLLINSVLVLMGVAQAAWITSVNTGSVLRKITNSDEIKFQKGGAFNVDNFHYLNNLRIQKLGKKSLGYALPEETSGSPRNTMLFLFYGVRLKNYNDLPETLYSQRSDAIYSAKMALKSSCSTLVKTD